MWHGDLSRCERILVFGGCFDPPHWAHLRLPSLVREIVGAGVVLYVPVATQPLKRDRTLTPADHRLRMLELALADQDHAIICRDEIDRRRDDSPSYTVDTLERLRERIAPNVTLRLLIGGDQLRVFDRWKSPDRIIELALPVVMVRAPDTREQLLTQLPAGFDPRQWATRIVNVPAMAISSTEIRRRLANGEPIDDMTPAPVAAYIRKWNLYRPRTP